MYIQHTYIQNTYIHTYIQTYRHLDIATTRPSRPRGPSWWKYWDCNYHKSYASKEKKFILTCKTLIKQVHGFKMEQSLLWMGLLRNSTLKLKYYTSRWRKVCSLIPWSLSFCLHFFGLDMIGTVHKLCQKTVCRKLQINTSTEFNPILCWTMSAQTRPVDNRSRPHLMFILK